MAVNRYVNGKIYKLVNPDFPDLAYIGSTIENYLCKVINNLRNYKSMKGAGIKTYANLLNGKEEVILIEEFPCKSKDALKARVHYYIRQYGEACVNSKYKLADIPEAMRIRITEAPANNVIPNEHRYNGLQNGVPISDHEIHDCEVCGSEFTLGGQYRHYLTKKHERNLAKHGLSSTIKPEIMKTLFYRDYRGSKLEHYEALQKPE